LSDNTGVSDLTPNSPVSECPRCVQLARLVAELQSQALEFQAEVKRLHSRIRDLEAKLNTHSGNSSLPPSANPPGAPKFPPRPPTGRKPGGQPGHKGHSRERLPVGRVDRVIEYFPGDCGKCHAPLSRERGGNDPEPVWHQVAELPPVAAIVTEHQGHGRRCAGCGHVTFGRIPDDIRAHAFGPRLAAAVVFLSSRCHGSKRIVAETVQSLFGVPIALGSISNLEAEVAAALAPAHLEAEKAVREAPVKNADETGWSVAGKLCWLWMAATNLVACFKITAGRGKADFLKLLGEDVAGVVGSDRWHAYNDLKLLNRQLCWAHLKRDFQKWLDRGGEGVSVGQGGLAAVKRIFELWRDFRQGLIDRPALQAAIKPVQAELQRTLEARRHCADKKVALFCRKILAVDQALWTFTRIEGVEPTNNHAERTLRLAVIWRKISFGSHSENGCRFTERILTVVQTLRLQKRNVIRYLEQALEASRADRTIPTLLPIGA
jgi:transposase